MWRYRPIELIVNHLNFILNLFESRLNLFESRRERSKLHEQLLIRICVPCIHGALLVMNRLFIVLQETECNDVIEENMQRHLMQCSLMCSMTISMARYQRNTSQQHKQVSA